MPATSIIPALLVALAVAVQAPAATHFDSNRAWEDLRQLVAIGPRPAGSPAIEQSRKYIKDQLAAAGIPVVEQSWDDDTPLGRVHMVNLIATIPAAGAPAGAPSSRQRIIIAGHYDTKRFRDIRFVGADDGGSSAAMLLELGRVLKTSRNPVAIELLFLDGEEAVVDWTGKDHTYGSRHYVAEAKKNGTLAGIKAMILVDMVGDRDLRIEREANSTRWLTDAVWDAARRRQLDQVFVSSSTPIEDDHLEFLDAGVPSVDIIDLDFPAWHTAADTLDAVSARSLQTVGDVVLTALPDIETHK